MWIKKLKKRVSIRILIIFPTHTYLNGRETLNSNLHHQKALNQVVVLTGVKKIFYFIYIIMRKMDGQSIS